MESEQTTSPGKESEQLSSTERGIAALWREVLPMAEFPGATDDFFALGGDSMAMVTMEYRIKEEFSVELPPGAVLVAPTLRELSALVDAASSESRGSGAPASSPADMQY